MNQNLQLLMIQMLNPDIIKLEIPINIVNVMVRNVRMPQSNRHVLPLPLENYLTGEDKWLSVSITLTINPYGRI